MRVFRLTRARHAALDGEGARRYGGRWNSPGRRAVYTAAYRSLALLEVLVNLDLPPDLIPADFVMLEIEITGAIMAAATIYDGSIDAEIDLRAVGDAWIENAQSVVFSVPSVIVPAERNYIVNPEHPQAAAIAVASRAPFAVDERLTRILNATSEGIIIQLRPNGWAVDFFKFEQSIMYAFLGSVAFARFLANNPNPAALFSRTITGSAEETE